MDGQIEEIIADLTADPAVWRDLADRGGRLHLFVGLFMAEENEGLAIAPRSLALLAERGVTLSLDVCER